MTDPIGHMEDHELTLLLVPSVIVPSKLTNLIAKLKEDKFLHETISPLSSPLWSVHRFGYLEIYLWLLVNQCHSPTLDTCSPNYGYCHKRYCTNWGTLICSNRYYKYPFQHPSPLWLSGSICHFVEWFAIYFNSFPKGYLNPLLSVINRQAMTWRNSHLQREH